MAGDSENSGDKQEGMSDNTEEVDITARTATIIVAEILLRTEQIDPFKKDLEELCNRYLNMS